MALVAIHVKKPREAQIWNCCTGDPVLRILPDSNDINYGGLRTIDVLSVLRTMDFQPCDF